MPVILGNDQIGTSSGGSLWNEQWSQVLQTPIAGDLTITRGFVRAQDIDATHQARMGVYELDTGNRDNSTLVAQSAIVSSSQTPGSAEWYEFAFNNELLTAGKTYILAVTLQSGGPICPYYGSGSFLEAFRVSNSNQWPNLVSVLGPATSSVWTNRDACIYLECEDASVPLFPPTWSTIPSQNTTNSVNRTLDVSPYAASSAGPLVNWALVSAPAGFTINSITGVITCAAGTAPNSYAITARVSNDDGTTSSSAFSWSVNTLVSLAAAPDYTAVGTTTAVLRYTVPYLPATVGATAYGALRSSGTPRNSSLNLNTLLAQALPSAQAVPGTIYAAIRTSGPYTINDQAVIKAGTGAIWFSNAVAQYRQSFLADGLPPNTTCYYGMYDEADVDSDVTFGSFTTQAEPAEPTLGTPPTRRG